MDLPVDNKCYKDVSYWNRGLNWRIIWMVQ